MGIKNLPSFLMGLCIMGLGIFGTTLANAQEPCAGFTVWPSEECQLGECYPEYQAWFWLSGESPDGYFVQNNYTGESTVTVANLFITDWMWTEDPYSYTIYPVNHPECGQIISADSSLCYDKKDNIDFNTIFAGQAEQDYVEYNGCDPITFSVLDNDQCVESCVLSVSYPINGGELVINPSDCTLTFTADEGYCGIDTYEYLYLDYNGNYVIGEVTISCFFQAVPEIVCNKADGTFEVVVVLIDAQPGYTWSTCDSDTQNEVMFGDGVAVPVTLGPFASDQGENSTYCVNFYNENGKVITTVESGPTGVSCVKTALELLSFSAEIDGDSNLLKWSTATEEKNAGFILERSYDGYSFKEIARIDGSGNSNSQKNYSFADDSYAKVLSYYRLVAVDFDGTEEIVSNVKMIERRSAESGPISVSPVPAKDNVTVQFQTKTSGKLNVKLMSVTGAIVSERWIQAQEGQNQTNLNIEKLPAGMYLLSISNKDEQWISQVIKE